MGPAAPAAAQPLIGSQRPRLWTAPDRHRQATEGCPSCGDPEYPGVGCGNYLSTDVLDWARGFGYRLDDWQQWALTEGLGVKPDGRWASFENAVILSRQNGKGPEAFSNTVLTRSGWRTFATIRPGDEVLGSDGQFTLVTGMTDIMRGEPCFAVTFTDGARITVSGEHLWQVQYRASGPWRAERTKDLARTVGGRRSDNGRMEYNWRVRCDTVPDLPEADLPVDPYVLGYWLGDGTSSAPQLTVGKDDIGWVCQRLRKAGCTSRSRNMPEDGPLPQSRKEGTAYTVPLVLAGARPADGLRSRLRRLGVLGRKHIPEAYLTASIAQRKALLAGLMDSDGSVTRNNTTPQCEFSSSFPALADGMHQLLRSLGVRVTPVTRVPSCNGKPGKESTRFLFTAPFNPFEMPRKAERWQPPASRRHELMSITAIEPVPSVPVRCIQVANADGVYLTGRLFTPTHNCVLEIRELAGLFVIGEDLIIHTSHELKALDVSTEILTHNRGWTTMGGLQDRDLVYAPDGTPTPLTAHPWRSGRPCYKVAFADGQEVIADAEHLWDVTEAWLYNGKTERKIVTTQVMADRGCVMTTGPRKDRERRAYRWRVDLPAPVRLPHALLPVDPWLLGAWLGDGTATTGNLTVGEQDLPYMTGRLDAIGERYRLRQDKRRPRVWTVTVDGLLVRLRELGVLGDKHVPEAYLLASEAQRRQLLAGVMDTDGAVSGHQLVVGMKREQLMRQVLCLVRSLGYRATFSAHQAKLNGKEHGPIWNVRFAPNGTAPFGMERKTARITRLRTSRSAYNAVVSVTPVDSRPTRCITVAHPSGCYLVGRGFAVTHNTSMEHFRRVTTTIDNYDALRRRLKGSPTRSHGFEAIELLPVPTLIFGPGSKRVRRKVGSRLRFLARSRGSSRGFTCDTLIYDEAMILSSEQIGASLPTMAAVPNPQVWYMGSAGHPDSDQLAAVRRRIVRGDGKLFGAEWSARLHTATCPRDEHRGRASNDWVVGCAAHDDRDSPATWARTNPAYGIRLREEFIANELEAMPPVEFNRERLGVGQWPSEEASWGVIAEDAWAALTVADAGGTTPPIAFAVDVAEDGEAATIGAAWSHREGKIVIEVPRNCSRPGTSWALPRLRELARDWKPVVIVVPKNGPAAGLGDDVEAAFPGRVLRPGSTDEAAAFAWFLQQVKSPGPPLAHLGKARAARLWKAVGSAETRPVGDGGKTWSRRDSDSDITPVTAVTLAAWGLNRGPRSYDPVRSIG